DVLRQGVQGVSDLITRNDLINSDFNDVRRIMANSGSALMGIGVASGEDRAVEAARQAINSPLLEVSIEGAKGVLLNVRGGDDLSMSEINEAASIITQHVDRDANVIFGMGYDTENELKKGEVKVTVIATGFSAGYSPSRSPLQNQARPNDINFFGTNESTRPAQQTRPDLVRAQSPTQTITPSTQETPPADADGNGFDIDIPAFIRRKMK
ncbi:MAG: Cell division protein FtsZ, partial [Parcubacteria group bacterium GW2011_GWB1_45_7]